MVQINANLRDSLGQPLAGKIRITLTQPVATPNKTSELLTVPATVDLVAGSATFDLEPTTDDGVSYLFEVLDANDLVVRDFTAQVPESGTAIEFAALAEQSGITRQSYDTNLSAVVRRMYVDDLFWDRARETLAPYKGVYDADAFYKRGDVVLHQGSSWVYVAAIATAGSTPSEAPTSFWRLWARKGEPGAGTTGSLDPYDALNWAGNPEAVSKASMVGVVENLVTQTEVDAKAPIVNALLTNPRRVDTLQSNANSTQLTPAVWVRARINEISPALNPIGSLMFWIFPVAPAGYLHLDGRTFLDADYPTLAALYGKRHNLGGDPATVTRLPDFRGATVTGADTSPIAGAANRLTLAGANTLGEVVGSNTHTLTIPQLPTVNLQIRRGTGSGSATGISAAVADNAFNTISNAGGFITTFGGGQAHDIVQASGVGHWIQYAGAIGS
jgi:microcystin-dependent protein